MKQYGEYKDSGIQWIGKIPSHWHAKKIKFSCNVTDGTHFSPPTREKGKLYITVSNVHDDIIDVENANRISEDDFLNLVKQGCQPQCGDVLLAKDGTVGRTAIVKDNDYVVLSSLGILHPLKGMTSEYLKYSLDSSYLQEQMNAAMAGSALRRITINKISEFISIIPPVAEQQSIASYLDYKVGQIDAQIDAAIKEKELLLNDLKTYRSAIISEAVTKGLDKNAEMKDSSVEWIGKIPKTWKVLKIKQILDYTSVPLRVGPFGSSLSGNDFKSKGYWVYNQRVVLDNNFETNDTFISQEKYDELCSFQVMSGDILLTTRGTIGKVAVVPKSHKEGVLHPCLIKFRVDERVMNKAFLKYYFNDTDFVLNQVKYNSNSTTIDVIYSYTLKELIITVPPIGEQTKIVSYLDKKISVMDKVLSFIKDDLDDLTSYKSSLITEAVTGKVDLRNWKKQKEAV